MDQDIFSWLLPFVATLGAAVSAIVAAILAYYQVKTAREIQNFSSIVHEFEESTKLTHEMTSDIKLIETSELPDNLKERIEFLAKRIKELEEKRNLIRGKVEKVVVTLGENPKTAALAQELADATAQNVSAGRELLDRVSQLQTLIGENAKGNQRQPSN